MSEDRSLPLVKSPEGRLQELVEKARAIRAEAELMRADAETMREEAKRMFAEAERMRESVRASRRRFAKPS